ncbi:MAG: tetratricopeptide repeat protein [Synechococcus sp. ELA057]
MPLRRRLRHVLIRWLGGEAAERHPEDASSIEGAFGPDGPGQLVLPAADAARQALLAGRYFAHAEDLIGRGAPELAAPFYRQAYVLLGASRGGKTGPVAAPSVEDWSSMTSVIDLDAPPSLEEVSASPGARDGETADPGGADAVQRILQLEAQLSRDTADAVAQEALRLSQQGLQHPELDHLLGLVHVLKGESGPAAERFRMAIAQDPGRYRSLVNLAGLLVGEGRLEEAQALLHKALEQVNPDSEHAVPALTNLSLVHQAAGRPMEEAQLVLRIHRLKPGHLRPERLLHAAGVLEEMAEEPAAIELLQWLDDHGGDAAVWQPLATLLERRGDYQAAALVYRRLLQLQQPAAVQATP